MFTDEIGRRITPQTLCRAFKLVVTELGFSAPGSVIFAILSQLLL